MARYDFEGSAGHQPNAGAVPDPVGTPIIFIAPSARTVASGEIWIAVSCADSIYGGCFVWASYDGTDYFRVGRMVGNSTMGALLDSLPAATGVDDTNTLSVDVGDTGEIENVSAAVFSANDSLCWVGGEFLAFRDAALVDIGQYDLSHLRRGLYGSTPGALLGDPFAVLDDHIFRHRFNAALVGTTIYFKFQGHNLYGGGVQDLEDCTEYPFAVGSDGGVRALVSDIPTTFDASAVVSGVFPLARIPAAALERIYVAADSAARYSLTTAEVQNGDVVRQADDGTFWIVVDDAQLDSVDGYQAFTAGVASTMPWIGLTDVPDNISAFAALTGAADYLAYFTGLGTMALAALSSFGRSLMAAVDAAAARAVLGLGSAAQSAVGDFATAAQGATADGALQRSGGTMSGDIACAGNGVTQPKLKDIRETPVSVGISGGAVTFDFSLGNFFYVNLNANITSISFSGVPANGNVAHFICEFTQDATGGRTVAGWPSAVKWPGGTAPTITATANAVDIIAGYTRDGGTKYRLARAHADSR